jgi:hypothetical protein
MMIQFAVKHEDEDEEAILTVEAAVLHDTLLVLAEAVRTLDFESVLVATDVSCSDEKSWELGATFFNYINAVEANGITGKIRFQVLLKPNNGANFESRPSLPF